MSESYSVLNLNQCFPADLYVHVLTVFQSTARAETAVGAFCIVDLTLHLLLL